MLPPLTTRSLQAAIESKRREDAARRWVQSLRVVREPATPLRRDIPAARPTRG